MQFPFNKNIDFIDKGIIKFHEQLWSTSTCSMSQQPFSWTCALAFIEIKWLSLLSCVLLCLRIYSCKRIQFFKFIEHDCALQYFWARLNPRETCCCGPPFFADCTTHIKEIKVCINSFSQFLYVPNEVRLFSFLLNERFDLGPGLWRLGRQSCSQHLAADDGHNRNCGFPTLPNVNQEI